jgi:hypothetical protein
MSPHRASGGCPHRASVGHSYAASEYASEFVHLFLRLVPKPILATRRGVNLDARLRPFRRMMPGILSRAGLPAAMPTSL